MFKKLCLGLALVLCVVQIVISPKRNWWTLTETERATQIDRMHDYPPSLYRIAHLIEQRPESILVNKVQKNFFDIYVFEGNLFWLYPVILVGILVLVEKRDWLSLILGMGTPLLVLTALGPDQPVKYLCLLPFIVLSMVNGIAKVAKIKR